MSDVLPRLLLATISVCTLSACHQRPSVAQTKTAAAPSDARLWSIDVMEGGKSVSRVEICADQAVRDSFARPAPEVGGQPCIRSKDPVKQDGTWFTRCRVDGAIYRVSSVSTGDVAKDFTVDMAVTRHDRRGPVFEQVRRYRLEGDCPAGWRIGESAAPGDTELLDTLSGARRPRPHEARD